MRMDGWLAKDRLCTRPGPSQVFKGSRYILSVGAALMAGTMLVSAANPILFVTQVPVPTEVNANVISNVFVGVGGGFGNHLADTLHAPRGGDLWLGKPLGSLTNLA